MNTLIRLKRPVSLSAEAGDYLLIDDEGVRVATPADLENLKISARRPRSGSSGRRGPKAHSTLLLAIRERIISAVNVIPGVLASDLYELIDDARLLSKGSFYKQLELMSKRGDILRVATGGSTHYTYWEYHPVKK